MSTVTMKKGDSVFVEAKVGDIFSEDFTGTVVGFERGHIQVSDQDGCVFDVDLDQVIVIEQGKYDEVVESKSMIQVIKLTEKQMLVKAKEFLRNCDADELARIIGDMYGVDCFAGDDDTYEATPNENYCGGLDDVKKCAIVESTKNHQ